MWERDYFCDKILVMWVSFCEDYVAPRVKISARYIYRASLFEQRTGITRQLMTNWTSSAVRGSWRGGTRAVLSHAPIVDTLLKAQKYKLDMLCLKRAVVSH